MEKIEFCFHFRHSIFIIISITLFKRKGLCIDYRNIITFEPGKRSGKPCIRGLRTTIYDILEYLASGMSFEEILDNFPELMKEDLLAALSYTADREKKSLIL
jgi:uncharacterized protein (DUF433 family)